jgi:hypothetical protein
MKTLDDLTAELLESPEVRAAYDALAPEFAQLTARYAAERPTPCTPEDTARARPGSFPEPLPLGYRQH